MSNKRQELEQDGCNPDIRLASADLVYFFYGRP